MVKRLVLVTMLDSFLFPLKASMWTGFRYRRRKPKGNLRVTSLWTRTDYHSSTGANWLLFFVTYRVGLLLKLKDSMKMFDKMKLFVNKDIIHILSKLLTQFSVLIEHVTPSRRHILQSVTRFVTVQSRRQKQDFRHNISQ
jgi:hypothetical protein